MSATCPVCSRAFRDAHGRGGHLSTYNDAEHDAYRTTHAFKHPVGPDGKPTVVGLRWRGEALRVTPVLPVPASDAAGATPMPPALPTAIAPPLPVPDPPAAPAQAAETGTPPPPPAAPAPSGAAVATAFGIGVGSLVALVLANKGKHAPAPQPAQPARDPMVPNGIWTEPDAPQPTGYPYIDRLLGYSGLPKTRRTWL